MGINGSTDYLSVDGFEFGGGVGKGDDFGWADESEVKRVEEEDHPFSEVVGEFEVFVEGAVWHDGCCNTEKYEELLKSGYE